MDRKQLLKELEDKYQEMQKRISILRGDIMDFEETSDYQKYSSYTQDAVKETMFPEMYAKYKELDDIYSKVDAFYNEIINQAVELNKEVTQNITQLEEKLETDKKFLKSLERKIKLQQTKINKLKATDEYKNGDEATLLKVEEMELQLKSKFEMKQNVEERIKDIEQQLEKVKEEKDKLIYIYGEEIDMPEQESDVQDKQEQEAQEVATVAEPQEAEKTESAQSKQEENKENEENTEEKTEKQQGQKKKKQSAQNVVYVSETQEDELEKATQEGKDLEEEFKELYSKAKRRALTDKDFDRLSEIMQNADNYDKLGISTGIIFNKSRVIFKAMAEVAKIDDFSMKNAEDIIADRLEEAKNIVKKDRDSLSEEEQIEWDNAKKQIQQYDSMKIAMNTYQGVSTRRIQEKWSWLFEFDNSQNVALPEETEATSKGSKSLTDTLAEKTVSDEEYKDVESKEVSEPDEITK